TVHHDLDRVHLVALKLDRFAEIAHFAVDARAHEACLPDVFENLLVAALTILNHRREDLDPRPFRPALDRFDDLLSRLRLDALATHGAVGDADPRVEQAQIVVNFGDGADGRARVVADAFLVNRDRRRQPL